jgi:hypothetical protein
MKNDEYCIPSIFTNEFCSESLEIIKESKCFENGAVANLKFTDEELKEIIDSK